MDDNFDKLVEQFMADHEDLFREAKWSHCTPYDDILAKVDYIEQTDAGLKIHCYKIEKENKMNKNEELKNVDTIIITRRGNTVSVEAYEVDSGVGYPVVRHKTIAECSPDDIFDFNIGAKLAFDRLYEGYDFTPKPKRKPYNGKIFVHHYPGTGLLNNCLYRVKDGIIQDCWYHKDAGGSYIFRDMTNDELCRTLQIELYGSYAPSAKVIAYFVRDDKA